MLPLVKRFLTGLLICGSVWLVSPSPALADEGDDHSYWHQITIVDAISLGLGGFGFSADSAYGSAQLFVLGGAGYVLGGPIVHVVNGYPGRAVASLGLRLALPAAGLLIPSGDDFNGLGLVAGMLVAVAIDNAIIATDALGGEKYSSPSTVLVPLRVAF